MKLSHHTFEHKLAINISVNKPTIISSTLFICNIQIEYYGTKMPNCFFSTLLADFNLDTFGLKELQIENRHSEPSANIIISVLLATQTSRGGALLPIGS